MEKEIKIVFKNWFWWGFLSLVVVAFYGTLMRYKIAFSFPFFEQNFRYRLVNYHPAKKKRVNQTVIAVKELKGNFFAI